MNKFYSFSQLIYLLAITSTLINGDQFKIKSIQLDGLLAAFGDFNSDKYSDLFIINSSRQSFEIQKAIDLDYYSFLKQPNLTCSCSQNEEIVGLIPSDFFGDAMMDVIIITKFRQDAYSSKWDSTLFNIYLVRGTRHSLDCKSIENQNILFQSRIQPLLLDYNGDMIGDLLVQASNYSRYIYLFDSGNYTVVDLIGNEQIRTPNSNAFIDLDNDYIPDLFIEGENVYEYIYLKPLGDRNQDPNKSPISRLFKPDEAIVGHSTFIDYNSDGIIDHLIPVCGDYGCSKSSSIVVWNQEEISYIKIATNFIDPVNKKKQLCFVKEFSDQQLIIPMRMRHADVDGDGFIDLVALMTDCSNPDREKFAYILKNVPNTQSKYERTFKVFYKIEPKYKTPSENTEVILASFLDLAEDGNPDFVVVSKQNDKFIINTIVNENMVDACFFKVLVISGRCYEDCGKSIDNKIKSPFSNSNALGYGTNQAGPSIYYSLVDSEGKARKSCAGQLTQTADLSLQMPYMIFGLGMLPNFVDLLTASLPINYTSTSTLDKSNNPRIQSWTQIVPDSQVVIIPNPIDFPSLWRIKLFLTPSDNVLSTFLTLIVICFLLSLVIFFLWRREVLEDRLEQKKYKQYWPESK